MSGTPVTIERSVIVESDPEMVFGFLIGPHLMSEWFGISHVPGERRECFCDQLAGHMANKEAHQ